MKDANELVSLLNKQNEELKRQLEIERNESSHEIESLKEQINELLRRLYGRKSERFENPNQLDFLKELGWLNEKESELKTSDIEKVSYTRKRPKKPGPKPLPEHLPRVVVPVDPAEADRVCGCCQKEMERVDEVVTEELDIVPLTLRVKQYVQGKYRCTKCMNRDVIKPLPPRPIEKGRPSSALLAYLVVSKYVDHLPLHRQEQIFKRQGVQLVRSTMDEWFGALSPLLLPVVLAMKRRLLRGEYLQVDETPIEALDRELQGKTRRCYLWSYSWPDGEVVYDVTASRAGRHPRAFLEGFRGHVQTDGYTGYREVFAQRGVEHVACMAHIRRKFFEATHAAPEEIDEILGLIRALYAIEGEARENDLTKNERHSLRCDRAPNILEALVRRIDALAPSSTPKSKLGKAIRYARGQWDSMRRYIEVPEAEIDNNACERSIRPAVIGRKNFLFLGSLKAGGERASVFYSLSQSAKRLGLNPFDYLVDVIERVSTHPQSRIDELTPKGWLETRQGSENASGLTAL